MQRVGPVRARGARLLPSTIYMQGRAAEPTGPPTQAKHGEAVYFLVHSGPRRSIDPEVHIILRRGDLVPNQRRVRTYFSATTLGKRP